MPTDLDQAVPRVEWASHFCFIEADHGYLTASFNDVLGIFLISDMEVEAKERRNGFGKLLLRTAMGEAQTKQARFILGSIISKEALLAARSVFGSDSIVVEHEGEFIDPDSPNIVPIRPTEAHLLYRLASIPPPTELSADRS